MHGGKANQGTTLREVYASHIERGFPWQLAEALRSAGLNVTHVELRHKFDTCEREIAVSWLRKPPQDTYHGVTRMLFAPDEPIENVFKALVVAVRMESS